MILLIFFLILHFFNKKIKIMHNIEIINIIMEFLYDIKIFMY